MAYKGSFYYDEFDYGNYQDSLDYETDDEHLPTFVDVLSCGISVLKQISFQLLCLLSVNFLYRLIRQSSELSKAVTVWWLNLTQRTYLQTSPNSLSICLLLCSDTSQPSSFLQPATFLFPSSSSSRLPSWRSCSWSVWRSKGSSSLRFKSRWFLHGELSD